MQLLVPIALFGWLPLVLVFFRDLKGHRALAAVYVTAWLFLPSTAIRFRGLPDFDKSSATSIGVILAILLFEPRRLMSFRPHWLDALMVLFCVSPIPSSITNELGLWDGCSNSLTNVVIWGLPYFFGRLYFDSFERVRTLSRAIFIGGLVYIPFCLVEMRMSPQFYNWVYGLRPRTTLHSRRYGGWRPTVFLDTGLELGMWMTAATLIGFALWYSGALKRLWSLRITGLLAALFVTTVLCKSTGSLLLLIGGIGMLVVLRLTRSPWLVLCLVMVPITYISFRSSGANDGSAVVRTVENVFGSARAESLAFRFYNEDMLVTRAWEAPWFGWGGWGRERVLDEFGEDQSIVDGMWIVTFGKFGILSLILFYLTFMAAPTAACFRFARPSWRYQDVAPVLAISLLLLLYMVDCLLNAMDNALYPLSLGAVTTLLILPFRELITFNDAEGENQDPTRLRPRRLWPPVPDHWEAIEPVGPVS